MRKPFYTRSKTKSTYVCTFLFLCVLHLWRLKPSTAADPPQLRTTSGPKFIANLQSHSIQPHNFFVDSLELTGLSNRAQLLRREHGTHSPVKFLSCSSFSPRLPSPDQPSPASWFLQDHSHLLGACFRNLGPRPPLTGCGIHIHLQPNPDFDNKLLRTSPFIEKSLFRWITSSSRRYVLNVLLFFLVSISMKYDCAEFSLGVAMPTIWWAIKVDERLGATTSRENKIRSAFRGYHHL